MLYVGAFAYIINNFNWLASIVFRSFAGLGITATGSAITMENFLQPGRLAKTGIDAGAPILEQIGEMAGFPEVFVNLDPIVVMFLAWLVVVLCFFVLAIQLFITLIEFADHARRIRAGAIRALEQDRVPRRKGLGQRGISGVKVLVLAVIVGIGSGLFAQFQVHPAEPSIDHALVIMLASLTLLALGIFGPGIATGLVSGAPQLGAGAMAGAAVGAAGTAVAIGAAATGVGGAVAAGARMAPAAAKLAGSGARAATSAASSAKSAFQAGSAAAGGGAKGAMAGLGNVAKTGAQAAGRGAASRASAAGQRMAAPFRAGWNGAAADGGAGAASGQVPQARPHPAPLRRRHRNSPLGPSACIAASNSPTPRPPPPTRCAVAMAAAPARGRACAIPIHKEN